MLRFSTVVSLALATVVLTGCPFFTAEESTDRAPRAMGRTTVRVQAPAPAAPPRPTEPARPAMPTPAPTPPPSAGGGDTESIGARHILVQYQGSLRAQPTVTRSEEEARARATEVARRAKAGEDFAALAREMSDGPTGPAGGDLGTFPRGRMHPAFEQAAFALGVDEVSEVVQTPFGFHVIKRYR